VTVSSSFGSFDGRSVRDLYGDGEPARPTGTVEFQEEGTPITGCTAENIQLPARATCTVTGLPSWSSYTVTAAYSGDSSYLASVSFCIYTDCEPPAEPAGPFRFFSPSSF